MSFNSKNLSTILQEALREAPLAQIVRVVADAFESQGVRVTIVAVRQGDATPLLESRIQQADVAGIAMSSFGQKVGAWLTMLARPRVRRGPQPPPGCRPRGPRR